MPDSLHSEILVPGPSLVARMVVGAAICGAAGAAIALLQSPTTTRTTATLAPVTVFEAPAVPVATTVALEAPPPADEIMLVFSAGGRTYMKLADGSELAVLPRKPVLHDEQAASPYASIAAITPATLPAEHRAWSGRRVIVDRDCEATVVGFAMVSRLVGSPGYAPLDGEARWTARNVMEHGSKVLAAELSGCAGTYARDAALAPVVIPEERHDAGYEATARARLLESALSADIQEQASEIGVEGSWYESAETTVTATVLRHPVTNTQWVWAHARREDGCGGVNANLFALFRVGADGALVETEMRDLGELTSIDQVIDIEGDGAFELVGKDWLGVDRIVMSTTGENVTTLHVEFYGCPC